MLSILMQRYNALKAKYPDAILLFKVGDFYECFSVDAINASNTLGLTLTKDKQKNELAGFPHYHLDNYLIKLVKAGYKVALVEQDN